MPKRLTLDRVQERLRSRTPAGLDSPKRAAVAMLLQYGDEGPSVLLMRRAQREGDRWSGHVALPGGREEEHDVDLQATARRETMEEVGVCLSTSARYLGALDPIRAMARGKVLNTVISPFVYEQTAPVEPVLNHEASHVFWMPLVPALRGEFDSSYSYPYRGQTLQLPCWRYEGEVVWGLTYEMLGGFFSLLE